MDNADALKQILKDMDTVAKALGVEPFSIYFLGGSACILGGYSDRMTRDFDFVDLDYPAHYGRVLRYLNDFDMLEYESTILAPSYQERAIRLNEFQYLNIFILSREDIIVSKIIRMEEKDLDDMDRMIGASDKKLILKIIDEVLSREHLYPSKKNAFLQKLPEFRRRYNV
ncbi:MAG: hypothetical protein KBA53_14090 [Thermoclostridium sp.]|nr:hypothetical protein [Thermoclostridium sp.]